MATPRFFLPALLLLLPFSVGAAAEEIPLENCDRLPVLQVRVSGTKYLFLVDTAANSVLDINAFPHGEQRRVVITSWNETIEAPAREVTVADLAVGEHHFKNIKLPAVDLSSIGRRCGRIVSGILGVDLLRRLGASVELRGQMPQLVMESASTPSNAKELYAQLASCEQAFNRADEGVFAQCLDEHVVIFSSAGDFYGRNAAMEYFRRNYFQRHPPAQVAFTLRAHHDFGDAIWFEYEMRITAGEQISLLRGSALGQKENGSWRIVHMNHSKVEPQAEQPDGDGAPLAP